MTPRALVAALALTWLGCGDRTASSPPPPPTAGAAPAAAPDPRPRPAEVAHLTLKVLGMT